MDKLLQPDTGLMIWTVVTFLVVLFILSKTAWKPILTGLNQRERRIRDDLDRAEKSQKEAEALRLQFDKQLNDAQKTIQDMMSQARSDADSNRQKMLSEAKAESERIMEKGRKDLTAETERLKLSLQKEVGSLSIAIAEKIVERSIDPKIEDEIIKKSITTLGGHHS
jgi:F-type H+-transporting ATPase subunit b